MDESKTTELIVIRHGETEWNRIGRQQGQLDTDLSDLGRAQAQALADALAGEKFDALYSSDLGRAMQTAEIIAPRVGLEIIPDARLRETHLGLLQGMTIAGFQRKHPQEYERFCSDDPDYRIPGGESARDQYERSVACAEAMTARHAGGRLLTVTHGGVLDSFLRRAVGLDLAARRRFSLYNASINSFSITDGQWRLGRWGDTHHLKQIGTKDDW